MNNQKLGIALATGAITLGLSNRYLVHNKYGLHHAALSVGLGLIVGIITYNLVPADKPKNFDFIMPTYDYDKSKYKAKVLTALQLPDGIYDAGWTGYSVYINNNGDIIEAKTDDGVRSPFPIPCKIEVTNGVGFVLQGQNQNDKVDSAIWKYYSEKYPNSYK